VLIFTGCRTDVEDLQTIEITRLTSARPRMSKKEEDLPKYVSRFDNSGQELLLIQQSFS
jgi:hypothetical protein